MQQSRSLRTLQSSLVAFAVAARDTAAATAQGESAGENSPHTTKDDEDGDDGDDERVAKAERQLEAITTDLAVALNNLGSVYSARLEYDQAEVRVGDIYVCGFM